MLVCVNVESATTEDYKGAVCNNHFEGFLLSDYLRKIGIPNSSFVFYHAVVVVGGGGCCYLK